MYALAERTKPFSMSTRSTVSCTSSTVGTLPMFSLFSNSSTTRWVSCSAVSGPLALPLASKDFIMAAWIFAGSKATVRPSRFLMLFMVMPESSPSWRSHTKSTTDC